MFLIRFVFRRLVAFDVMSKTHRWDTVNNIRIFLKIISKLTRNQRNAEENSTFYSPEILTAHPTASRA